MLRDNALFAGLLTFSIWLFIEFLNIEQLSWQLKIALVILTLTLPALIFELVYINTQKENQSSIKYERLIYIFSPIMVWFLLIMIFWHFNLIFALIFFVTSFFALIGFIKYRENMNKSQ